MINPNTNPHTDAVEELLKWEEQGIRNAFDPELVVMADLKLPLKKENEERAQE